MRVLSLYNSLLTPAGKLVLCSCAIGLTLFLFPPTPAHAAFPGYNGKIVFDRGGSGNNIFVMNRDGTDQTELTNDKHANMPAWSPDGSKIAYNDSITGFEQIYVMNVDGSGQTKLTTATPQNTDPAWSPDGGKIVYVSYQDGNAELYIMNADGSDQMRLTNNSAIEGRPAWSPDGARIAFHSTRSGNYEIYTIDPDGTNLVQLTNTGNGNYNPKWSPDGSKIVFESGRDGHSEVYTMNADGSDQTRVTISASGGAYMPSWSPDGMKLLFISDISGNLEVYSSNVNGGGVVDLTNNAASDLQADWQPIPNQPPVTSPDSITTVANTTATADVLANDTDEQALSGSNLTVKTNPTHGLASIVNGKINYIPAKDYAGSDQLIYQICDSFMLDQKCATGVLGITVTAAAGPLIIPTPAAVPLPVVVSVGTVHMNGATTVYYTGHRPVFGGTAEAGATVMVTIHSDPIVLTTVADSSGKWSVTPGQDISDGEHQVVITASKDGVASAPVNLVLGINVGLAATGASWWPALVGSMALLLGTRVMLKRWTAMGR